MTPEYLTRGPVNLDASMTLLCLVKQHYLMGCGLQGCLKEPVKRLPCDSAFQASLGFSETFAFGDSAVDVGLCVRGGPWPAQWCVVPG